FWPEIRALSGWLFCVAKYAISFGRVAPLLRIPVGVKSEQWTRCPIVRGCGKAILVGFRVQLTQSPRSSMRIATRPRPSSTSSGLEPLCPFSTSAFVRSEVVGREWALTVIDAQMRGDR
ncbi:unnamed protein product, partial [Mycena citricolor]